MLAPPGLSIAGLRKYVIDASATRLYALLDIGALGTVVSVKDAMKNLEWVDPQLTAKAAIANKPAVIGIKVRLSKDIAGAEDMEGLKRAREAAEASQLPMMLHIGDTNSPLPAILSLVRPRDIITQLLYAAAQRDRRSTKRKNTSRGARSPPARRALRCCSRRLSLRI